MPRHAVLLLLAAVAWLPAPAARAGDDDAYNRVGFSVESSRDVENDEATATIGVTREDTDPARLADAINQDVQWGLSLAKAEPAVSARTAGYRTYPISDPEHNRLRRWRGGQDLVLESRDPAALSKLLGRLQEKLQLKGIHFSVSRDRRTAVEGELIDEALAAFRARAARVQGKLGAKDYELVNVQIETAAGAPPPMPMRAMAMEASPAPPAVEGGTSTLTVHVRGTIELTF